MREFGLFAALLLALVYGRLQTARLSTWLESNPFRDDNGQVPPRTALRRCVFGKKKARRGTGARR